MRKQRTSPPYIHWPLDRWKLLVVTVCTAVLLLGLIYFLQTG